MFARPSPASRKSSSAPRLLSGLLVPPSPHPFLVRDVMRHAPPGARVGTLALYRSASAGTGGVSGSVHRRWLGRPYRGGLLADYRRRRGPTATTTPSLRAPAPAA